MYYEFFNKIIEDNENKICIFEIGAFYVVIDEQAMYLNELWGLKKVCFAPGICKVGFSVNSLLKYIKKLTDLSISFVVLSVCNMDRDIYWVKSFKKKYEFIDQRFKFNSSNYICDCNKCVVNDGLIDEIENIKVLDYVYAKDYVIIEDDLLSAILLEVIIFIEYNIISF